MSQMNQDRGFPIREHISSCKLQKCKSLFTFLLMLHFASLVKTQGVVELRSIKGLDILLRQTHLNVFAVICTESVVSHTNINIIAISNELKQNLLGKWRLFTSAQAGQTYLKLFDEHIHRQNDGCR